MAAPWVRQLDIVEFNSIRRTVLNLSVQRADGDTYNDTAQYPMNQAQGAKSGSQYARVSFTTELNPSGSAAGAKTPPDGPLFKACGLAQAINGTTDTTYTFDGDVATNHDAETISTSYGGGLLTTITNSVGNVNLVCEPNRPVMANWSLEGTYTAPAEGSLSGTLTNGGAAPVCLNTTMTLNSDTLVFKRLAIAANNRTNAPNYDMAATTGVAAPRIVFQAPTIEALVEVPAASTANYWTDWTSNTLTTLSAVIGTGAGYILTIAGKGYMAQRPEFTTVGGLLMARLVYRMDWASGSPITLAFT